MQESVIQLESRLNQQKWEQNQGRLGAFQGVVVSTVPQSDEFGISYGPANERIMPVPHPFVGPTSWIRAMPEVGSTYLMQTRFDSGQAEAIKIIPLASQRKSELYREGQTVYRTIAPGELDLASNGLALAFLGRRGALDLRSGASVKFQLASESQDIVASAPAHHERLTNHVLGEMGDERRLGMVRRWTNAAFEYYVQAADQFQAESYVQLKNPAGQGPAILLRKIEGQVYGDDGQRTKHLTTSQPLRVQNFWYTNNQEAVREEIDEIGNVLWELPSVAQTGWELMIPEGNYRASIGKNRDVQIQQDEFVQVGQSITYTVGRNVSYDIEKNLDIEAGDNQILIDVKSGFDLIHFLNSSGYGIASTNQSGGSTRVTGPGGSALSMTPSGNTLTSASGESMSMSGGSITQTAPQYTVNAKSLYLGAGASVPAMLGLATLSWLDQHKHEIAGVPTTPPTIPAAAFTGTPLSLVSSFILLKGN